MGEAGNKDDRGRVVLVTGAGKGLGAAFAQACAARGMKLVVNNRVRPGQPDSAAATVAAIRAAGGEAVADTCAVEAPGAAAAIVAAALAAYGRLDAVILNAGISGQAARIEALDPAELWRVMEINFFAAAALAQAALAHLLASDAGRLVFVSSSGGLHGIRGRAPYAASKAALNGFALTLADEVRRTPLKVNVLCPYAATAMTAGEGAASNPRLAPANAAGLAVHLASRGCSRHGQIYLAGAGYARRARTVESAGAPLGDDLAAADAMDDLREFTGAEAGFADFFACATRVHPMPEETPCA